MGGVNRRQAVKLTTAAGAVAALGVGAGEAEAAAQPERPKKANQFKGTSKKGDIKEALDLAIAEASKSAHGNDRMVRWTLKEISGVNGGIAGLREITVTIEAAIT